jgi:outer membrane protein assembly factor BamB
MIRAAALIAIALTAVACSSAKRENVQPPAELVEFTPTVSVQRIWSRGVGDLGGRPGFRMAAAHVDGRLYVANTKGDLLVLDAATGGEISRFQTGRPFATTPAVAEGAIAVGTIDGHLVVFDAQSGAERFAARLTAEVIGTPEIAGGRAFVRSHDGRVSAYDLDDGTRAWIQETTVPALSLRGNAPLRHDRGFLLVPQDDGRLVALRADDGTPVWQQQVGLSEGRTDLERLADVDGEIAIADGVVFAVGFEGQAMAIDVAGGTPIWARDMSSASGIALGEQVFVSSADGKVHALDRLTGDPRWSQDALLHRWLTTPAVVGSHVAVADVEGYVHWLNVADGSFAARERVARKPVRAAPLAVGNTVFVTATDGTLAAYRVGG